MLRRSTLKEKFTTAGLGIVLCLAMVGCSSTTPEISASNTPSNPSATPSQATPSKSPKSDSKPVRLQKTIIKTKQGQRWELEAEEVNWMNDQSQAQATDVTWYLLDPKGNRAVKVVSDGADVDMGINEVTFTGEVVARRLDSEETLTVKHLVYAGKERVFHGSQGVLWKRKGIELSGETLTATAELDKVQLKGRVKGKSEGGQIKLDDGATSDQRNR